MAPIRSERCEALNCPGSQTIEAIVRILCDNRPPKVADGAYLFVQTPDNERSVFDPARKMMDESLISQLWISDAPLGGGYAGGVEWEISLQALGLNRCSIGRVPFSATRHNTLTEAEALVRFVKQKQYGTVILTAAPFHQVRAFMTTVKCGLKNYPALKLYSYPGAALDRTAPALHSQGAPEAARFCLIYSELERIASYCSKGDLISYADVIEYLNRRGEWVAHGGRIEE